MLLYIFGHVDVDYMPVFVEELESNGFGKCTLSKYNWTKKQEAANRLVWLSKVVSCQKNEIGNDLNDTIQSNDSFLWITVLGLALAQADHWDTGPLACNFSSLALINAFSEE